MPFGPYKDFDDCLAKNQDKEDPNAYCGFIKHQAEGLIHPDFLKIYNLFQDNFKDEQEAHNQYVKWVKTQDLDETKPYRKTEAYRHRDYNRILNEFNNYYCKDKVGCTQGESEYYQWLKALELNETVPYGATLESFTWAKNMLKYLREDSQYKYYSVLVGFPIESMNGNVYKERDLIAAALTLKGSHPNLNHKDQWHFTPDSRWGEITTEDARFENGAVEAIIRVSKSAVCPVCDGKPMTELIDKKRIVNVSLQGGCRKDEPGGVCDGFQFDDKGFSLLTTDVLPGIPMARIFPLEHIMVEALQVSTAGKKKMTRKKKKTKRVEARIVEQEDEKPPCSEGETRNPETGECEPKTTQEDSTSTVVVQPDPHARVKPDAQGQCPEGMKATTVTGTGEEPECVPLTDEEKEQQVADSIKPDLATDVIGTPPTPSPTILTSGPTFGHKGTPLGSDRPPVLTTEATMQLLRRYEQVEDPYGQCKADQMDQGFSEEDAALICKTLKPVESAHAGEPGEKPPTPPLEWPEVTPQDDKLQAGDPAPTNVGHTDPVDKAGTPKRPDTLFGGEPYMPEGDKTMHPTKPGTVTPPDSHGCDDLHHWDEDQGACMPNAPLVEQETDGKTPGSPQCGDGEHWDPELEDCVPDAALTEWKKRYLAELALVEQKKGATGVKKMLMAELLAKETKYRNEKARRQETEKLYKRAFQNKDLLMKSQASEILDLRDQVRKTNDYFAKATRESKGFQNSLEDYKIENAKLKEKYNGCLRTNLEMTQKSTRDNEEYLKLAKRCEQAEQQVQKARNMGKKIVRLKPS